MFGNQTVCFQHFIVPIYLYFSAYCSSQAVNQYSKRGQTSQSRHSETDADFSAKRKTLKKKQLRSQAFLIVITFMLIIIRVQRAHSQNSIFSI